MTTGEIVGVITTSIVTVGGIVGGWLVLRGKRLELASTDRKETATATGEVGRQRIISESEAAARLWDRIDKLEKQQQLQGDAYDQLFIKNADLVSEVGILKLQVQWNSDALIRVTMERDTLLNERHDLTAVIADQNKRLNDQNERLNRQSKQIEELQARRRTRDAKEDQEQR